MELNRTQATEVVEGLFNQMELLVTAYGPKAIKPQDRVDGTAFFPGGSGLWRGVQPGGQQVKFFPERPVMVLGHNFDKVSGLSASVKRGVERIDGPTWLVLRRYLEQAELSPSQCFFTNVFVGLQPSKAVGKMDGGAQYECQCRTFLQMQVELVRPRLVALLGKHAAQQYEQS